MEGFIIILLYLMGLCWGSFLNVLIVRTMSGESILFPFSKCPKCGQRLYWWHNIPLVSYFILKGKCYFCNKTISPRYPVVELIGLAICVFAAYNYISVFDALSVILILSMFFVMAYTDYKMRKIAPAQAIIVILSGLVFGRYDIYNSLFGGIAAAGLILLLMIIGVKLFNKETFGFGDIYLFGALGAVVGIERLPLYLFYLLIIQFLLILPKYILNLIKDEQAETLKYLILFGVTCFFLYVLRGFHHDVINIVLIGLFGALLYFMYKLVRNLFLSIKTNETQSYCPLAPAVAISCLMFLC